MSTDALFALDVLPLTVFAILVSWALTVRTDGAAHKRLMILATVALLGPALSRWPYDFVFSIDLAFFGTLDSFLIFMIAFDLYSRRKVQAATILGCSLIVVMDLRCALWLIRRWCIDSRRGVRRSSNARSRYKLRNRKLEIHLDGNSVTGTYLN